MTTPALETQLAPDPQLLDGVLLGAPAPDAAPAPVPGAEPKSLDAAPAPGATAAAPTGPSAEVLRDRQELAAARQRLAQMEEERAAAVTEETLQREYQAKYQEALGRGLSEEDALWTARSHYAVSRRVIQQEQTFRQQQMMMQGKRNAAAHFGELHGVDPRSLMRFNSPQEMEEHASGVSKEAKRISDLEAQVKALTQGQVPAQNLNAPGGGAGNMVANDQNIDKLWFDYDMQHPNQANPYEAAYRKLVYRR